MSNSIPSSCSDWSEELARASQGDFSPVDQSRLNGEHCFELFYRVLQQNDQRAKEEFQQHCSEALLGWLRVHPRREEACRCEKEEYYVVQAFECFWQATLRHKTLEFSTLTIMLQYLQASLNGVILDTLRNYSCSRQVALSEPTYPMESISPSHLNSDELWKILQGLLTDTREQRMAYLLFHCSLEPREIVQFYPREFSDVREISRLRHRVIEWVLFNQEQVHS